MFLEFLCQKEILLRSAHDLQPLGCLGIRDNRGPKRIEISQLFGKHHISEVN